MYALPAGVSPESTVVYGYPGTQRTVEQVESFWSWNRVHPEIRRRALHMWFSHPHTAASGEDAYGRVILHSTQGVGGGARDPVAQRLEFLRRHSTSPTTRIPPNVRWFEGRLYWLKKGMAPYAPPGSSNHEDGTLDGYAAAYDAQGWTDGWANTNCGRFHLKHFADVNKEPWHFQPVEFRNSKKDLLKDWANGKRIGVPSLPSPLPDSPAPPQEGIVALPIEGLKPYQSVPGVITASLDGTIITLYEYNAARKADLIYTVPTAEIPDQWGWVGQVIANAGGEQSSAGAAIAARFRAAGGVFPNAA